MHTTERSSSGSYNCFVDFVGQSSRISENVFLFTIFLFIFIFSYYFKNECQGFIRFPKARKHLKQRLETWWNPKREFLKLLLQQRKLVEIIILINEFKHISYLRHGMSGPVTYLVLPGVCVIQCHVSVTWLFVTSVSKHVASQYRWQSRDLDVLKLVKKKKRVWPVLYLSLPDIKTNGRLAFLIICKELDFLKLQRCNRLVSVIRDLTKTTTARATGTSKK